MSITETYPDSFFTTTAMNRLKKVRSNQFRPNRLATELLAKAENDDGGMKLTIPFDIQEHSTTTQAVTGYEPADTAFQDINKSGTDDYAFNFRPVGISWIDDAKNTGRAKLISMIEQRVENTENALMQQFERRVLRQSAIAAMSDINTLNGDDEAGGFLEGVASPNQDNTVHGISKSTYSSLVGFQNQYADCAGDASANLIGALYRIHGRINEATKDPTQLSGFCSILAAENYGKLMQSFSALATLGGDPVNLNIKAAGMTYKQCSNMPNAGTFTGTSDQEWSFLVIDHNVLKLHILSRLAFQMTKWRDVGGAHEMKICFFRFGGQLAISDWRSHGIIAGADTY